MRRGLLLVFTLAACNATGLVTLPGSPTSPPPSPTPSIQPTVTPPIPPCNGVSGGIPNITPQLVTSGNWSYAVAMPDLMDSDGNVFDLVWCCSAMTTTGGHQEISWRWDLSAGDGDLNTELLAPVFNPCNSTFDGYL